jgi:hypothetical protein
MKFYCGKDVTGNWFIYPLMKVGNFTHLCIYIGAKISLTSYDESQLRLFPIKDRKLNKSQQRGMIEKIMDGQLTREMSLYR